MQGQNNPNYIAKVFGMHCRNEQECISFLYGSWWCFHCDSAQIFAQTSSPLEELCDLGFFWKPNALLPLLISPILAVTNFPYKAVNSLVWDSFLYNSLHKSWIFQTMRLDVHICKFAANLEWLSYKDLLSFSLFCHFSMTTTAIFYLYLYSCFSFNIYY